MGLRTMYLFAVSYTIGEPLGAIIDRGPEVRGVDKGTCQHVFVSSIEEYDAFAMGSGMNVGIRF